MSTLARFERVVTVRTGPDTEQLVMLFSNPPLAVTVKPADLWWFGAGWGWDWRRRVGQRVLIHCDEQGRVSIGALVRNLDFERWWRG